MTRKHFKAIAAIIEEYTDYLDSSPTPSADFHAGFRSGLLYGVESIAISLAEYFQEENPRFDQEMFLEACGVKDY